MEALINLINQPAPTGPVSAYMSMFNVNARATDVESVARAQLQELKGEIASAIPGTSDKMSKYHLQDVEERIKKALDPKS